MTQSLDSYEATGDAVRAWYRRERAARWEHVRATVKTLSYDEVCRLRGELVAQATRDAERDAAEEGYNG